MEIDLFKLNKTINSQMEKLVIERDKIIELYDKLGKMKTWVELNPEYHKLQGGINALMDLKFIINKDNKLNLQPDSNQE